MGMKFNLAEMVFLILLDKRKGTFSLFEWPNLPTHLAQAVLGDLAIMGCLQTNDNQELLVKAVNTTLDPLQQDVYNLIKQSGTAKTALAWISVLQAKNQQLVERVIACLVDRGALKEITERFLRLFSYKAFRVIEPDESFWIGMEVRAVALACEPPGTYSAFLLQLLTRNGLLQRIFEREEIELAIQSSHHLKWNGLVSPEISRTLQTILTARPSRRQAPMIMKY